MRKFLGEIKHDLSSFRLDGPEVPATDQSAVQAYRIQLTDRLTGHGRLVVPHPASSGRIIDWAAEHRFPIKPYEEPAPPKGQSDARAFAKPKTRPVYGVVDAAVWLTVVEAARQGQVSLITSNITDFADPADPTVPSPDLVKELESAGCNPTRVTIYQRVIDFTKTHIDPIQDAVDRARRPL